MSHGSMSSKESGLGGGVAARQLKQAAFTKQVEKTAKEEKANHIRWYTVLCMLYVCLYLRNDFVL